MNAIISSSKFNTKQRSHTKNKKPAMLVSATSMAALLTACDGEGGGGSTLANISGMAWF